MNVTFLGGCQTAYGVNPACFTTEDAFTQKFIENSDEFKSGSIKILRVSEINGTIEQERNNDEIISAEYRSKVEIPTHAPANVKKIEVADKNEAIEYLKENYGSEYTATRLRTKSAFDAACEECGVEFEFSE